jgi:hypothetical protein
VGQRPSAQGGVDSSTAWRIKDFQETIFLNLPTAIRYVTQMHDQANSPELKANAETTLAALRKLTD